MSEIRLDLLHNKYVLIAPERLHRPNTFKSEVIKKQKSAKCPFCEGNEYLTPHEIFALRENEPNNRGWKTRVVPNLYNALSIEQKKGSNRNGMFENFAGVGAHEVLIDSTNHDKDIVKQDTIAIELWLKSLTNRIDDLRRDKRLTYLSIFKNYGKDSGATQEHPHTQLLALPIMPKNELDFLKRNYAYYKEHDRGIVQDVMQNELFVKKRIIEELGNFTAFCPFASSFPFEVIIAPKRDISTLLECKDSEITDLSQIIKNTFKRLDMQLGKFDYNLYFNIAPLNSNFQNEIYMPSIEKNFRFTLRIIPRIYKLGGFELANEMSINPLSPEECTKLLKQEGVE